MFMSSAQPAPAPEKPPTAEPCDGVDNTEGFCEILDEILEIGLLLTRQIRDEAASLGSDKATIAFDRVTRAIRRTMLLATKLTETPRKPGRNARNPSEARAKARAQVQEAIDREPPEKPERDPDHTSPDRLDSIGNGTVPEIIASLCKDLAGAANTIGKPTQRGLLLATTRTTSGPSHPGINQKNPAPDCGRPESSQPNPARYRGSG
jgi:hypothetical protein